MHYATSPIHTSKRKVILLFRKFSTRTLSVLLAILLTICVSFNHSDSAIHRHDPCGDFSGTSRTVLPSIYQAIPGYTWEDIYVILISVIMTNLPSDHHTPIFTIVRIASLSNPVLIAGFQNRETGEQTCTIYSVENETLYQMHQTTSPISYDPELELLYLEQDNLWLAAQKHVLYEPNFKNITPHASELTWYHALEHLITSENIHTFIQEVTHP